MAIRVDSDAEGDPDSDGGTDPDGGSADTDPDPDRDPPLEPEMCDAVGDAGPGDHHLDLGEWPLSDENVHLPLQFSVAETGGDEAVVTGGHAVQLAMSDATTLYIDAPMAHAVSSCHEWMHYELVARRMQ